MHVRHLSLHDFRNYPAAEVDLTPGIATFVGRNGHGKTNLVEAIGYVASLESHRVPTDAPLVRFGATSSVVRVAVVSQGHESLVELEINPGRANRARLNRSPQSRPRDVLGTLRTVLFAPEDIALVKGDPAARRRFLDDLLVQRQPRWSAARADYDRILKQRNALLKSAAPVLRRGGRPRRPAGGAGGAGVDEQASALHTLDVWDHHLSDFGAKLVYARLRLLRDLGPHLTAAYGAVSDAPAAAVLSYRSSLEAATAAALAEGEVPTVEDLTASFLASLAAVRDVEFERGVTLVGPHRDDVVLTLGELPAKGYASHGESWSFALGLKLAAYELLRHDLGDDPVLVLDDVFAELDGGRRRRLAGLITDCEQVLITAAVEEDVPVVLTGRRYAVRDGEVAVGTPEPGAGPAAATEPVAEDGAGGPDG